MDEVSVSELWRTSSIGMYYCIGHWADDVLWQRECDDTDDHDVRG